MTIAVFGATGKTGRYLVPALLDAGREVLALGRDRGRLKALDPRCRTAAADLEAPQGLADILAEANEVVSLAHARFTAAVLQALPADCGRVVLTGSTRRFTALPDPAADAVRRAEQIFAAAGRPGVMLHPSMIFGAAEERNVNRILDLFDHWPKAVPLVVPLPDGGRHHVQPIYFEDAVAAVAAAVLKAEAPGAPILVAGPAPLTYAEMVGACARALGRRARIVPVPSALLGASAGAIATIGFKPPLTAAEIRRATEDKTFSIADMESRLGVTPRDFAAGLDGVIARRRGSGDLAAGAATGDDEG